MQKLHARNDLDVDMTSMRSVGYRQAWLYLDGDYDYDLFIDKSLVATRQLAKRQLTWLRKESDIHVMDPFSTSPIQRLDSALQILSRACE